MHLENALFFIYFPLYDQPRYPSTVLTLVVMAIFFLEFLAVGFTNVNFNGVPHLNKIIGFFDGSSLLSLFDFAFVVFEAIALFLAVLQLALLFIMAALYKKIASTAPWIAQVYRVVTIILFNILYIPVLSIFISSVDCTDGHLTINPTVECWNGMHVTFTVVACIFFTLFTLSHAVYSYFVYPHSQKQGGLLARLSGWPGAIFAVYVAVEIMAMHVFTTDAGWRAIFAFAPSSLLIAYYVLYQPFYQRITNYLHALAVLLFFSIRIGGEVSVALSTSPTSHIVLWVLVFVISVGCAIGMWFGMKIWERYLFLLPKNGQLPVFMKPEQQEESVTDEILADQSDIVASRVQHFFFLEHALRFMNGKSAKDTEIVSYASHLLNTCAISNPKNSKLIFYYALFTQQYRKLKQKADHLFTLSRNFFPPFYIRFVNYSMEKSHSLKTNQGESASDSAENQNAQRNIITSPAARTMLETTLKFHQNARQSSKDLWNSVIHFNTKSQAIPIIIKDLMENEKKAKSGYDELLKIYPNNPYLLRLYANLLKHVMNEEELSESYEIRADQIEDIHEERDFDDMASHAQKMKKKKKKTTALLQQISDDPSTTSSHQTIQPYFIPLQSLLSVILIGFVLGGVFVIQTYYTDLSVGVTNLDHIFNTGRRLGRIALYSKYYFMRQDDFYPTPITAPLLPTEDECIGNLSELATDLLKFVREMFVASDTQPWEVQDTHLLLVTYVGKTVSKEWFSKQSVLDAVSHVAYAANNVVLEGKTSSTFYANLAEPIVNFPTTLMESIKRMLSDYLATCNKSVTLGVVISLINTVVVQVAVVIIMVIISINLIRRVIKRRNQAQYLLLSVPRNEIYKRTLSLLTSENEAAAIQKKWEKEDESTDDQMKMNLPNVSVDQNMSRGGDAMDLDEEEEEEEIQYAEEPVRVTVIDGSIVTGGTFSLESLIAPPLPQRPHNEAPTALASINLGAPFTVPRRVIRRAFAPKRKKLVLTKAPELQEKAGQKNSKGDKKKRRRRRHGGRTTMDSQLKTESQAVESPPADQIEEKEPLPNNHVFQLPYSPQPTAMTNDMKNFFMMQQQMMGMNSPLGLLPPNYAMSVSKLPFGLTKPDGTNMLPSTEQTSPGFQPINMMDMSSFMQNPETPPHIPNTDSDHQHSLKDGSLPANSSSTAPKLNFDMDDEETAELEHQGIVRNAVDDSEWLESLEKSIEKITENQKKLQGGVTPLNIILLVALIVFLLTPIILTATIIPLNLPGLGKKAGSVLLWTNTMLQFYQTILFTLQMYTTPNQEIKLVNTTGPQNPEDFTSTVLKDFSHVSDDASHLHALLGKSFELFSQLNYRAMNGVAKGDIWTEDTKLRAVVSKCDDAIDELTMQIVDSVNTYQCKLENGTNCPEHRLQGVEYEIDLNFLFPRYERMMQASIRGPSTGFDLANPIWQFLMTAANFDLDYYMRIHETGFVESFQAADSKMVNLSFTFMGLQLGMVVLCYLGILIPLRLSINKTDKETQRFLTLIPSDVSDSIVLSQDMKTDIQQVDSPRESILEVVRLIDESVRGFAPVSDIRNLFTEMLLTVRTVFKNEEHYMDFNGYEKELLDEHKLAHIRLRQRLTMLMDSLTDSDVNVVFGSLPLFCTLFDKHFHEDDMEFAYYMEDIKSTGEPTEVNLDTEPQNDM
ncbi:hypothetical protein BLNAU_2859 [Blattamonas nauphoetae]|uniref:TmcB/TmcC TPR repeats domain-containing protein n=1 Tax=Blattamonas nauphoetae TaxID=2049346 RepID=A0ABQ9YER2_9EUKA|nr:hypothetical protein BLNAU_2859 [Blattamonas nauphoetae]